MKIFPSFRPPVLCTGQQRKEGVGINNHVDTNMPYVALTFDDGPAEGVNLALDFNRPLYAPDATRKVLSILEQYNAKATFFAVGEHINEAGAQTLKDIHGKGHEIGVHGWQHANMLDTLPLAQVVSEVMRTKELITRITGQPPVSLRPPCGHASPVTAQLIFSHTGMRSFMWTDATYDWEGHSPQQCFERIIDNIRPGSIVLMHDIYTTTPETLELLLPALQSKGYKCVTLSELLNSSNEITNYIPLPQRD